MVNAGCDGGNHLRRAVEASAVGPYVLRPVFLVGDGESAAEDQWQFQFDWLASLGFHYRPTGDGR